MRSTRSDSPGLESTIHEKGRLDPDEAFAVLGNETRIAILQALERADGPLAYSELKRQIGVCDSGRFNYHLDKLLGHFVERTEEGYRLQEVGERAAQAVIAGTFTVVRSTPVR